jgi:hypothetical protein
MDQKRAAAAVAILAGALTFAGFGGPRIAHALPVYTFSTCGATGATGPTQTACDSAYQGGNLDGAVSVNGGIQTWLVPETGTYSITAIGAQGASGDSRFIGGRGVSITGEFDIVGGTMLQLAVGQAGLGQSTGNGGGGGGSFVVDSSNAPLLIAGGGGGTRTSVSQNGTDASITEFAFTGSGSSTLVAVQHRRHRRLDSTDVALVLDFDEKRRGPRNEIQHVAQERHARVFQARVVRRRDAQERQATQFNRRKRRHRAATIGHAIQFAIVHHDHLTVAQPAYVQLNRIPRARCRPERRQRILRNPARKVVKTPMRDGNTGQPFRNATHSRSMPQNTLN